MSEKNTSTAAALVENTVQIVSAFIAHNHIQSAEIPALISAVHGALVGLATGAAAASEPEAGEKPTAAQIKKSIGRDGLISFIDGGSYKTLKRHLTGHGLTPDTYRARYGLPADYPMVAPSYSEQRSALAKAAGLGVPGSQADRKAA